MTYKKLIAVIVGSLIVTLSGQTTALASQTKGAPSATSTSPTAGKPVTSAHHGKGTTTTTTTLPTVPAAAEPLLKKLISVAGGIAQENEQAAALSESYDLDSLRLKAAEAQVATLDAQVHKAAAKVGAARLQLRHAAVEAYVTGEGSAVDTSLLANNLNSSSMVGVYASFATGHVTADVKHFSADLTHLEHLTATAKANAEVISENAAGAEAARNKAVALQWEAYAQLNSIKGELLKLVGLKEYNRLLSPEPQGSAYKGPNLAGVSVGKVATPLQALAAVAAAKKLLGVPYVWGGASPRGVDCSGLTMLAWAAGGITLEHSATAQWEASEPVPISQLQPGDLLFYHFAHDGSTPITHVVMYVGSGPYGKATVIQAAHTGTNVSYSPIFFEGLVSAGRP